jgi:hypothetical protein
MFGIHAPDMTLNEFFWGTVVFGSIIVPIVRSIIKWAWIKFVHTSKKTITIWYSYKKAHALRVAEHAEQMLRNAGP